jgi:hypothetical protein
MASTMHICRLEISDDDVCDLTSIGMRKHVGIYILAK